MPIRRSSAPFSHASFVLILRVFGWFFACIVGVLTGNIDGGRFDVGSVGPRVEVSLSFRFLYRARIFSLEVRIWFAGNCLERLFIFKTHGG